MALCTATATAVAVFSFENGNWVALEKPNQFTMKLFDGGNHYILRFYTDQKELLQLKLKATTTIQRHQESHSKCCEVNHENSIYLLRFATENACEVFVMAVLKAITKEKEKAANKRGTTAAVPSVQRFDGGYDAQMHARPRPIHETVANYYGSGQNVDYRPMPQPRSEWSRGDDLPEPYRHGGDTLLSPGRRSGEILPSPHRQRGDTLPSPHRQRPQPGAYPDYPAQEPAVQFVDYQEQPHTRSAGYPEQAPPRPHPVAPTQSSYYQGESPRHIERSVSEAEKAIQGGMSPGDLGLWLAELNKAINADNVGRAHQMVNHLMQYPKHVGEVVLNGTCLEKKESPCDSSEDCIRLQVTVESQQSSGQPAIIIVQARRTWKVKDLKLWVERNNLLPREVQKWIIGKRLARDDDLVETLVGGVHEAEVFMYVVKARKGNLDRMNYDLYLDKMEHQQQEQDDHRVDKDKEGFSRTAQTPQGAAAMPLDLPPPIPSKVHAAQSPLPVARPRRDAQPGPAHSIERSDGGSRPPIFGIDVPVASPDKGPVGWTCPACTFVNKPARPGCEMCGTNRPADYQPPLDYQFDDSEKELMRKLDEDEEAMRRNIEEERRHREKEREENFLALRATDFKDIIENTEAFECSVCYDNIEPGEGVTLRECLHNFCKDCLRGSIVNCDDAEVKCPFAEYECDSVITEREIRGVLTEEEFEKFEHRGIAKAEAVMADSFHCKTADCLGWCVYEDEVNDFPCPLCKKTNCLLCKAIHEGMNCKEYQDDLTRLAANDEAARATKEFLERMLTQGEAMRCSKCGVIVQKKEGCDWIKCSVCRTELCWATKGPRWGPKGRGDITGGCKCGVKGVRCTPHCGNCH